MKKNNLLIKLLTLLIIIAAVLPVFYMPAYAVEEEYGTQDISDHGISEQGENSTSSESETSYVEEGNNVFDIVPKGYTLKAVQTRSVEFIIQYPPGQPTGNVTYELKKEINNREIVVKRGTLNKSQKKITFKDLELNTPYKFYLTKVPNGYGKPDGSVAEFYFDNDGIHFTKGESGIALTMTTAYVHFIVQNTSGLPVGFLFDMDLEDIYSEGLHEQVAKNKLELEKKPSEEEVYDTFRVERYTFYYENKIMNLVSQGDIQLLKSGLTELGTSVLPILTSSSLKTEKNYTVIILEKLASLAIQVGKDIVSVIRLRNFYIKKVEEQTEFVGVLATRDSAIIHFTEELHGVSNQARTSLIRCVLQYINLKIYDNIKVTELAKQFYLSESALRSRFKEEIGVPINEYVNKRKIEESKMMIWSGIPAGEIARRLSFYDLSHYYRTFKKYTGVTPQQFRDTNIIGQEM